jgi:hypothetical protein
MAKIKLGGLAQDVRGSLAGTTFSKNASGAYVRGKVSPVQPRTSFQTAARNMFGGLSKLWGGTLTADKRTAWQGFAASHPIIDVFGDSMVLSGINTFQRLNRVIMFLGSASISDPPANLDVTALTSATVAVSVATGISIAFAPSPLAQGEGVYIWATGPIPKGRAFVNSMYKLVAGGDQETPSVLTTAYTTRFGAITLGSVHAFLICTASTVNGAVSAGLASKATAGA